jgi:hypothetical protein
MAAQVVWEDPRTFTGRRLRRALSTVVGSVLALIGRVGTVVVGFFGTVLIFTDPNTTDATDPPAGAASAPLYLVLFVVGLACWIVGVRLMRSHRRMVLFLRRFRYSPASAAVSYATRTIGASWRLVTLDDAQITPVGVAEPVGTGLQAQQRLGTRIDQWARTATSIAIGVMLCGGCAVVTPAYLIGGVAGLEKLADEGMLTILMYGLLATSLVVVLAGAVVISMSFGQLVTIPLQTAEEAKTRTVGPGQVADVAAEVSRQSQRALNPRLTVLSVPTEQWQQLVQELCGKAFAAIVDVSEPSDQVLWEIEELGRHPAVHAVFVMHAERAGQLASLSILDGQEVLAYTTDEAGLHRFARLLQSRLESAVA